MHYIRPELGNQAAQPSNRSRIWIGRLVPLLRPFRLAFPYGAYLSKAMHRYAPIVFARGQPRMPACGNGNLVAARAQFLAQELRLPMGAADKWWIMIAC
jgi:hypothetical protein